MLSLRINKNNNDLHDILQGISWESIWQNLRRPSLGLVLFLIGLNGMFFLPLIFPYAQGYYTKMGTYRYYLLSWMLICAGGALEMWESNWWINRRYSFWMGISVLAISIMTLLSLAGGEPLIYIINKSIPLYWLLLVPSIGLKKKNWAWILLTICIHGLIGLPIYLYMAFAQGITSRMDLYYYEQASFISSWSYMAGFLFMMLPLIRGWSLAALAFVLWLSGLLKSFFTYHRFIWLIIPIQVILLLFIITRTRGGKSVYTYIIVVIAVVVVLFASTAILMTNPAVMSSLPPVFFQAYDGLMGRMLEKGSVGATIRENERWIEIEAVFSTMHGMDWILGKGLAARWSSYYFAEGEERYMVHNTWLNAFFWGGVPLFIAIAIPLIWALRLLFRSRNTLALSAASYMIIIYMNFPACLVTFNTGNWVLFCLILGLCLRYYKNLETNKNKTINYRKSYVKHNTLSGNLLKRL